MVNTLSILPVFAWLVMWQTVQAVASEPTPYSVPGHASKVSVTVTPFSGWVTGADGGVGAANTFSTTARYSTRRSSSE
jgi:hypothetical protein